MVRIISVSNLKGGVGKHLSGLNLAAIIPCRAHTKRRVHQTIMDKLGKRFPDKVSPAVRENAALIEAPRHGKPVILFACRSNGAEDYRQVASWLSARFVRWVRPSSYSGPVRSATLECFEGFRKCLPSRDR